MLFFSQRLRVCVCLLVYNFRVCILVTLSAAVSFCFIFFLLAFYFLLFASVFWFVRHTFFCTARAKERATERGSASKRERELLHRPAKN